MINSLKDKYFTFTPGEFLPIYYEGKPANIKEFHMYKLKKAAIAADKAWVSFLDRAYAK